MTTKKRKTIKNVENIFLSASVVLLGLALLYNKLLGFKIELIIALTGFLLLLLGFLVKQKGLKLGFILINILVSVALFYTQYEFNRIFNHEEKEINTVSLVVMANSSIKTEEELKGKTFVRFKGFDEGSYLHFLKLKDEKLEVSKQIKTLDSLEETINALYEDKYDVLILDEGYRDIISEDFEKFDTDTRVIISVDYEIDKEEPGIITPETKNVDISPLTGHEPGEDPEETGTSEKTIPITQPIEVGKNSFTVLISGIDSRSKTIQSRSRSDVNLLMSVNMDTHRIALVSIPRDSFMPITCFKNNWDKITHSGLGGVTCTQRSIANYLNIPINYYAKVNFNSVIEIIDIVGPIEVNSHYTFRGFAGTYFTKGMNTLDGKKALEFSRTRKSVPGGDFTRGEHQMEVIKGTIAKLSSINSVMNLNSLVTAISSNVDTNIPSDLISRLVASQLEKGGWSVVSQSRLKGRGVLSKETYKAPNKSRYVMLPYENSVRQVRQDLANVLK